MVLVVLFSSLLPEPPLLIPFSTHTLLSSTLCPREYAMSNDFISKKKGGKNNLISQTVHLARQPAMFIFTFNQFAASVCSLQFSSAWIDHMWAVEVGGLEIFLQAQCPRCHGVLCMIDSVSSSNIHSPSVSFSSSLPATICYSYCISHAWRK